MWQFSPLSTLKPQRSSLIWSNLLSQALCCQNAVNINKPAKLDGNTKVLRQFIKRQKIVTQFKNHFCSLYFLFQSYLAVPSRNIFSDAIIMYTALPWCISFHIMPFSWEKFPWTYNPSKLHLSIFHRKHSPKINYFSKRKWKDSFLAKPKKNSFVKNKSQEQLLPYLVHWLLFGIFVKKVFEFLHIGTQRWDFFQILFGQTS